MIATRTLTFAALLVIAGAAVAGIAYAGGGSNISSAQAITPSQQLFGNTSEGRYDGDRAASYWKLALTAADRVTVDWESGSSNRHDLFELMVWPAGTTDFSINNASSLKVFDLGDNGKAESVFEVGQSGVYPLAFLGDYIPSWTQGGPYDFTVYVRHAVVLAVPPQTNALLQRGRRTGLPRAGRIVLAAHTAGGAPISGGLGATMFGYWAKKWHQMAHATATRGQIVLAYRLPTALHGLTRLSVNVGGPNYLGKHIGWRSLKT